MSLNPKVIRSPNTKKIAFPEKYMTFDTKDGPRIFRSMGYAFRTKDETKPALKRDKHVTSHRVIEYGGFYFIFWRPKKPDAYEVFERRAKREMGETIK